MVVMTYSWSRPAVGVYLRECRVDIREKLAAAFLK
jgi:hypothetical protein